MKVGVCGIAWEACPKMIKEACLNGEVGCVPKQILFCQISMCAFDRGVRLCFECSYFLCELTKTGPMSYGYCSFLAGRVE
jgi:hypothetical protein